MRNGRAVFMVVAAVFLFAAFPRLVSAQGDAAGAIDSARRQLIACYETARGAEAAGANITGLTAVLNDAGALLSNAESAYAMGDSSVASAFAGQCVAGLEGFVASADALGATAAGQRSLDFWVNVVGSAVGTVAVVAGGYVLWVFLRRRYAGAVEAGGVAVESS